MNLKDCHNFSDFRKLAKKKLPHQYFIILMVLQMMKLLMLEIQAHLMMLI
jgi:hypothetical protein